MIKGYYRNQPTHGGIVMNKQKTKILVVKNNSGFFGFPKGKISQNESSFDCAKR